MNISKILYWAERRYADKTAIIYSNAHISYSQLRIMTEKYINYFLSLDINPSRPVIIRMPSIPEFIYISMALNSLGISVILVNELISPYELDYIINDSGAEYIMGFDLNDEYTQYLIKDRDIKFIDFNNEIDGAFIEKLKPVRIFQGSPGIIVYTSGEDGYLRGSFLSYNNLINNILITREFMHLCPGDISMPLLPFYHAYGFSNTLMAGLLEGITMVLPENRSIRRILDYIQKYRIKRIQSVPMIYYSLFTHRKIKDYDISSLKTCVSGGSPIDGDFQRFVKDEFDIIIAQGFGITEASAAVTFNFFDDEMVYGSCGKLLPIFSSKIVDEDGNELKNGEIGELYIKSPSISDSYIGRFRDCRDKFTDDGWFKTGDLFMIDEKGNHYFKGLKKEMYLVGGYNIYPREIERIISEIEGVVSCFVYSDDKDKKGSHIVKSRIKVKNRELVEPVMKQIRSRISPYKMPFEFQWQDENDQVITE